MNKNDLRRAHKYCTNNKNSLLNDSICGCFYCLKIFHPSEIERYIQDTDGTAVCPYCGIDSVIWTSSGYPINTDFLEQMKNYWFEG